ncbi:MAG: ATP-binding protein [Clostridia bacterium]|nr:ATP-binding protein [Clostridia bacterium]
MIGRKAEVAELRERYESGRAELVAIYGRWRVGKTFLIDETFQNQITFRHAGVSPVDEDKKGLLKRQLEQFYYSLRSQGMTGIKRPGSWMEAFFQLEMFLQEKDQSERQLVFIDELPWLDTPRSGFLSAFEGFWNNWACHRKNVMVIVCGSASSWILDNLINNHGGLYGRVTCEIRLRPFSLGECEEFLKERDISFTRYDIVQSYMALGGIPYYLGYLKRNMSLAQNLDALFFEKGAKLEDEFRRLFVSIFDNPPFMQRIIRAVAERNQGLTRSEILRKLNIKDGEVFAKALNALVNSDFVLKYVPFDHRCRV